MDEVKKSLLIYDANLRLLEAQMSKRRCFSLSIISALLLVVILPGGASAQWSSNPLENLGVAVANGDQAVPKLAESPGGGCYISWFDNRSGSYCVYMQKLNSLGDAQWTPNGLLVSSHPQMTWLVDYDMTVDQDGNAVVVFADIRSGGTNDLDIFAYKISPDGSFLWGPDGIGLSERVNSNFEPAPKISVTSEGNFVVGWVKSGAAEVSCFQKISADGQIMWGESGIIISGAVGESITAPDLTAADNDHVVVIWKNSTGPPWAPTTYLYTQKFDPDGTALWNPAGVRIYDLGYISAWTYPEIQPDGSGGAFYTYHDSPVTGFYVWVQHVDSSGNLVFPMNGVQASLNSMDRIHMNPSLTYFPASDELFVFWVEANGGQSLFGVYGQKISPAGSLLWTDSGREFVALSGDQISFVRSAPAGEGIYVGYFRSPSVNSSAVKAFNIDLNGNLNWNPTVLSDASLGNKDDLLLVVNDEQRAFLAWDDARNDGGDIFAQNVNPDGTLGNAGPPPEVTITLIPENPPIVIPLSGGAFDFNIGAENLSGSPVTFDVWTYATLPNGSEYGPIINFQDLTLNAGASADRDRTQAVPASAPAGAYTYDGYAGVYPDQVYAEDHFDFIKSADTVDVVLYDNWDNWGEDFSTEGIMADLSAESYILMTAFPNPFNPETRLNFTLEESSEVTLAIYDVRGRLIDILTDGYCNAGNHQVTFNAADLPSGVYFARLTAADIRTTQKLLLLK